MGKGGGDGALLMCSSLIYIFALYQNEGWDEGLIQII